MSADVLAIDVGSGTQDVLVFTPGQNLENCPKLVVPSRTQIVGRQIRQATGAGKNIFLHGEVMGGGACGLALRQHLKAGLKAYATPRAALTFHDSLAQVEAMGVILTEQPPADAISVWLGDIDPAAFHQALAAFGMSLPQRWAVAVQDHGFSPDASNRLLRFRLWEKFVLSGGDLRSLVYDAEIPEVFTRMRAVRTVLPDAVLADTGTAALLGVIADPLVRPRLSEGVLAVNIGNSHTLAAAIRGGRVYGLFEQHTGVLDLSALQALITRFQRAELQNEEVFAQGGHGAALHPQMGAGWEFVVVTGPRRSLAKPLGWYEAAPYGDMMLTGCFGLLAGLGLL